MPDEKRSEASSPSRSDVSVGVRVRVTSGAFAGKSGVVAEVEERTVVVLLGQIAVKVAVDEIELAPGGARERPVLPTSHLGKRAGKKAR